MDWIERIFHVSPDGGNGSLELGMALGALVALAMIAAGAVKLGPRLHRSYRRLVSPDRRKAASVDRASR
jgi:hypothetical protein